LQFAGDNFFTAGAFGICAGDNMLSPGEFVIGAPGIKFWKIQKKSKKIQNILKL
jgi:hypothetical protein